MHKSRFCPRIVVRKWMPLFLAASWLCGIVFGVFCYSASSPEFTSLMRRTLSCSVSIVGLLNTALIPFLLSTLFIVTSMPLLIPGLCFVKAFLFSFVSIGILESFGSGGWLLRFFLLFSDCVALPLLFGYWLWSVSAPGKLSWIVTTCVVFFAIVLVTILDYRIIAPIVCVIDSMKG